ncbi:hypothetical protein [Streptomyces sp. NPDC047525]|uniref:hypothetical protein n=1 Tax=Streptomyces sp. NPDC047525 TaxID=3155264 RepID=UPI0033FA6B2D
MADPDFPSDLLAAQLELAQTQTELRALAARLPWSAQPLPGYDDANLWRPRQRPDSPGYTPEQQQEWDRLRARELELAAVIVEHAYWETLSGPDLVTARMKLKHAHEAPTNSEETAA